MLHLRFRQISVVAILVASAGCRMTAPIAVLEQPRLPVSSVQRVAIARVVAPERLADDFERTLLEQRPSTRPDIEVVPSRQLMSEPVVRTASTAPVAPDTAAIQAARNVGADVLLLGEIVQDELGDSPQQDGDMSSEARAVLEGRNPLDMPPANLRRPERIAVAWRVVDVPSGRTLGSQTLSIDRIEADRQFPDLVPFMPDGRERVLNAGARQSWQAVAPYVSREDVVLDLPWFQPGAAQVRRGNGYARQGRWDLAEAEWTAAATKYPFSNAAKHNLALAMAAREDFAGAKQQLGTMNMLRSRSLQAETLFWLDDHHRRYVKATDSPPPAEGFAFPEPPPDPNRSLIVTDETSSGTTKSTAPGPDELPLWTAIPFTKPPGWTWKQWLLQPWAL